MAYDKPFDGNEMFKAKIRMNVNHAFHRGDYEDTGSKMQHGSS